MSKMTIIHLRGGLGNQMFQYAVGRTLTLRNHSDLKFDASIYENNPGYIYHFRLDCLKTTTPIATKAECDALTKNSWSPFLRRPYRLLQRCLPFALKTLIRERTFRFDPTILTLKPNKYFIGWWQNEKYFTEISSIIRDEFGLSSKPSAQSAQLSEEMSQTESVSIHIRRGNYMTVPRNLARLGLAPLAFYHAAIANICTQLQNPHFFIFSDDMEWTQSNLRPDYPTTYVTHNGAEREDEDLWLMSRCKHHIIANSSFSWWGAWLGHNPNKIVYAPKDWFITREVDWTDLVPEQWHRL